MSLDASACIEHDESCSGAVEYRMSLSPSGVNHPRCDRHWELRLDWQEQHIATYPDGDVPPAWFDPSYAGERWNEDDA